MPQLSKAINEENELSQRLIEEGMAHAFKTGEMLLEVESIIEAGSIEVWIEKNCTFSVDTAKHHMNLASGKKVTLTAQRQKENQNE